MSGRGTFRWGRRAGATSTPTAPPVERTPPRAQDRAGEPKPVAQGLRLLRLPVTAPRDRHRHLERSHPAGDRLDQQLGGVELLLAQVELGERVGADRAEAVR